MNVGIEANSSSEPPMRKEAKDFNKGEETLEPSARLLRFLYTGNDKNVFISERCRPISIEDLDRLNFIKDMAALRFTLPFGIIKKVMLSNTLRRNDEAILAISYCLRRVDNIEAADIAKMKADIYKGLPELLKTDADMFLFVYLSNKILSVGNPAVERTSFGRGMKKALRQFYEQRTAEELADMFGRNRGMYGWTHRDIIHMCHMKFGPTDECDKAKLVSTLFQRGTATITELKELQPTTPDDDTWPAAVRRIYQICSLKVNESAADAAEMVKLHNFEVGHLPVHLIAQPAVWDILIPKMNYRELLKVFQTLHSMNMLTSTDDLSKKMCQSLGNNELIKASNMHPLEIYAVAQLYNKNNRYSEHVKNDWYQKKKVKKLNIIPNENIMKRLNVAVNIALKTSPQTGCDFMITLDMRESTKRHAVLRMKQLNCMEAMVMLALSFRKREKNTKIYSFTPDATKLLPVKLTADMSLEKALTHCDNLLVDKTRPNLSLPFKYVDKNSKNTIFITIVDSVARFCNNGEAPIDQFRLYRQTNTHSKFIVLNLRRTHGDLQFNYEKGFLEICGLTPDTWKLIHAFAINSFA